MDDVTLVKSKVNKVTGTLFLTATHIIFVEDKTRRETYVSCSTLCALPAVQRGSAHQQLDPTRTVGNGALAGV